MFLSGLFVYPIKSLKGIALNEAKIERRGLQYDRRWMLVDTEHKFMTQREHPMMATIGVSIQPNGLQVEANGNGSITVPFEPASDSTVDVEVWQNICPAKIVGGEAGSWFSDVLKFDCKLAYMHDDSKRMVDPNFAVADDIVSFADAYPFLLATEASLAELNSRLEHKVGMNRFRPNFIISGSEAFAEDDWKTVTIGSATFHSVKPSARCVMTTVDQDRGVKEGIEPLRTLATFRTRDSKVLFGQNLIAADDGKIVQVGDQLRIN